MKTKNIKALAALVVAFSSGIAIAQTGYIRPAYQYPAGAPASGPAGVQLGGTPFYFTPYVGVAWGYDDNLFLTNGNEKASSLLIFSPGFTLDARGSNSVTQIKHQSQVGRYGQSDADNYVDHTTRAQFDIAFDRRNFLRVGLDYLRAHDPRGSTDRALSPSPDKY